ncbi:CBS domain-containing protein [Arenibaculum pallidiluteum]|uniref:CBS domain-containing protein n=1 Tax=Arenibaculum pallidiluteum TaxID=2812559 RepID=UPI001A968CAD|nr:CBS domain-containing protein [Arenibaculum pallidiluteum]
MDRLGKTVAELLGDRRAVFRISPEASVLSALESLAEKDVGALIVCNGERLVGIVSERDCARKVELLGRTARGTAVSEIMTTDVLCVTLAHTIERCVGLMARDRLRHLPVLEDDRVVGVLSSRDVLEEMISEDQHLIHDLETERLRMTTNTGTY